MLSDVTLYHIKPLGHIILNHYGILYHITYIYIYIYIYVHTHTSLYKFMYYIIYHSIRLYRIGPCPRPRRPPRRRRRWPRARRPLAGTTLLVVMISTNIICYYH